MSIGNIQNPVYNCLLRSRLDAISSVRTKIRYSFFFCPVFSSFKTIARLICIPSLSTAFLFTSLKSTEWMSLIVVQAPLSSIIDIFRFIDNPPEPERICVHQVILELLWFIKRQQTKTRHILGM